MTESESVEFIRELLLAPDQPALMLLVRQHVARVDGTFFATATAARAELARTGKQDAADALAAVCDTMLTMKTLQ